MNEIYCGKLFVGEFKLPKQHDILKNPKFLEKILGNSCIEAGATILHTHSHVFKYDDNKSGISTVLVLAESHASIHTWPEYGILTIDIYMCGQCDSRVAYENFKNKLLDAETRTMVIHGNKAIPRGNKRKKLRNENLEL